MGLLDIIQRPIDEILSDLDLDLRVKVIKSKVIIVFANKSFFRIDVDSRDKISK